MFVAIPLLILFCFFLVSQLSVDLGFTETICLEHTFIVVSERYGDHYDLTQALVRYFPNSTVFEALHDTPDDFEYFFDKMDDGLFTLITPTRTSKQICEGDTTDILCYYEYMENFYAWHNLPTDVKTINSITYQYYLNIAGSIDYNCNRIQSQEEFVAYESRKTGESTFADSILQKDWLKFKINIGDGSLL